MPLKALRYFFVAAASSLLFWQLWRNWFLVNDAVSQLSWGFVGLALLTVFPVYFLAAFSWFLIIKQLGGKLPLRVSIQIWVMTNLSRYIPGVIWQYIGRVYWSNRAGLPAAISTISLLLEIVFVVMAATLLALLLVPWFKISTAIDLSFLPLLAIVVLLPLAMPQLFHRLIGVVSRVLHQGEVPPLVWPPSASILIIPLYLVNFLLNGLSLFLLIRSLAPISWEVLPAVVGMYAFSWLVGYVTIIAPGGIGATELSLTFLLSFFVPAAVAVVAALLFRLLLIIAELVTFLVTMVMVKL